MEDNRATCAGAAATLDFSLAIIARCHSNKLAQQTAAALVYTRRESTEIQGLLDTTGAGWLDPRLRQALISIGSRGSDTVGVAEAANNAGLSERQLLRLCQAQFGCSPRQYLAGSRLQLARTMIQETSLSINVIALAVGFASGSELSRAWRRRYAQCPTAFRRRRKS
jgi:transcriptional regulator GlxA family with amidase domain